VTPQPGELLADTFEDQQEAAEMKDYRQHAWTIQDEKWQTRM